MRGVSGMCTHQGCRLLPGELVEHQLPVPPAPLPGIAARELDGAVQVYSTEV